MGADTDGMAVLGVCELFDSLSLTAISTRISITRMREASVEAHPPDESPKEKVG
jgi:hypothetical protein